MRVSNCCYVAPKTYGDTGLDDEDLGICSDCKEHCEYIEEEELEDE